MYLDFKRDNLFRLNFDNDGNFKNCVDNLFAKASREKENAIRS